MKEATAITLIVGLGNPGAEYAGTRHNAGFMLIDALLEKLPGTFSPSHVCESRCSSGRFRGRTLHLQKPLTFMNLSGLAVAGLARKLMIPASEILVIYDDMDLPLGRIRIRRGGSSGGHRGVESVIQELGSADFLRLRVGIGHGESSTIDHVLSPVSGEEEPLWKQGLALALEAVPEILTGGVARAMNHYNQAAEKTRPEQQD